MGVVEGCSVVAMGVVEGCFRLEISVVEGCSVAIVVAVGIGCGGLICLQSLLSMWMELLPRTRGYIGAFEYI
jgi:hypothetical protein